MSSGPAASASGEVCAAPTRSTGAHDVMPGAAIATVSYLWWPRGDLIDAAGGIRLNVASRLGAVRAGRWRRRGLARRLDGLESSFGSKRARQDGPPASGGQATLPQRGEAYWQCTVWAPPPAGDVGIRSVNYNGVTDPRTLVGRSQPVGSISWRGIHFALLRRRQQLG